MFHNLTVLSREPEARRVEISNPALFLAELKASIDFLVEASLDNTAKETHSTTCSCPLSSKRGFGLAVVATESLWIVHNLMIVSLLPLAIIMPDPVKFPAVRIAGLDVLVRARHLTQSLWPEKVCTQNPVVTSHKRIVASRDAETRCMAE